MDPIGWNDLSGTANERTNKLRSIVAPRETGKREKEREQKGVSRIDVLRLLAVVGEVGLKVFPELLHLHRNTKRNTCCSIPSDESDSMQYQTDNVLR